VAHFGTGLLGGTATVVCSQPFDTIKTKLQAFPEIYRNSMLKCTRQTFRADGVTGFYRGSVAAVGMHASENAVLFLCYERIQEYMKPQKSYQYAICGSISGFITSFVICPGELIKCRFQAARELSASVNAATVLKQISRERGGFFQGLVSTWLRDVPGFFLYFYGKELFLSIDFLRKRLADNNELRAMFSGTFAGLFYWGMILPFDNVKTNIQVTGTTQPLSKVFINTFKRNPRLFYAGFWVTMIRAVPANVSLFYTYELCKTTLNKLI